MGIADLRREFALAGLQRDALHADPLVQFRHWFSDAADTRRASRIRKFFVSLYKSFLLLGGGAPGDVNAMTLATVDADGRPFARIVLLKGVDQRGFLFYTNYQSRKGQQLEAHPSAALVFYWPELERQVCVTGQVTKLPDAESDAYFQSRPRGSRIGAWASNQSQVIADREILDRQWREFESKYPSQVPRPPHWGGFVLRPDQIEFWQGRPNRLHDRFRYGRQTDGGWKIERLSP